MDLIYKSQDITNSEIVVNSQTVENSKNIFYSTSVIGSKDIVRSEDVDGSNLVFNSFLVSRSSKINESSNITDSVNICNSSMVLRGRNIIHSSNIANSADLVSCDNITNSFFCANSKDLFSCIFCNELKNKEYHIFNHPISPERFDIITDQYQRFQDSELGFIEAWPEELAIAYDPNYIIDIRKWYASISPKFWKWVRTLPHYDEMMLYQMTMLPKILIGQ